jgi:N-formylglutamate deformylase
MMTPSLAAYSLELPSGEAIPLLLDSPHSGTHYPEDFAASATRDSLRTAEDTHVEALFAHAPSLGATLLCARYPRAYIDCNRRVDDIDESMLDGTWPGAVNASEKTKLGYGLVWGKLDDGENIYSRQLSISELQHRIDCAYAPYWAALRNEAARLYERFDVLYHLNCHSMPSTATCASRLPRGTPHADVVIGDRDGTTAEAAFVDMLANAFRAQGLRVAINDPYKGVEIVRAIGAPSRRRHSAQIEINRALYMDERTREKSAGFAAVRDVVTNVLKTIGAEIGATTQKISL